MSSWPVISRKRARGMTALRLRAARSEDAHLLFTLRNDPAVVRLSRSGQSVSWEDHAAWFHAAVADAAHRRIFFVTMDDETIGVLRFDRSAVEGPAVVSIYLLDGFVGRARGPRVLADGCRAIFAAWPEIEAVEAVIIAGNERSARTFERVGFVRIGEDADGSRRFRLARLAAIN